LGDYSKKTKTLTLLEHGAYRLLLDFYYTCEGPFANDLPMIYRACSAHTPAERRAVVKILSKFFFARDGVWCHSRADEEIEKSRQRSEEAREKANKRWSVNMPGHMPQQCKPTTTTNNHKYYKNGGSNGRSGEEAADSYIEEIRARTNGHSLD
jgi:uncharacterized protein YdaU (DUF1376 family)